MMEVQQTQQQPSQFNQEAQPGITPWKWALYVFVAGLPLVGLIMLLVWAFGSDPNVIRRN